MDNPIVNKFGYEEGDIEWSACAYCLHRRRDITCDAFPDGIPDEILDMEDDHLESFEGDNGIQFEPRPSVVLPKRLQSKGET